MADNNPDANTHIYGTTSRPVDSPESEYPYDPSVEISDHLLEFDDWLEEDNSPFLVSAGYPDQNPVYAPLYEAGNASLYEAGNATGSSTDVQGTNTRDNDIDTISMGVKEKVAFKTKSEVEILDDGFKWRKYGKKMVKKSPNPRNYYKCSVEGCSVKKRVERDAKDPRYVITTYDGVHNHEGPSRVSLTLSDSLQQDVQLVYAQEEGHSY